MTDIPDPAETPLSDDVRQELGEALRLYRAGNLEKAEEICRSALALAPELGALHNFHGVILRARKKPREAVRALREAVRLAPGDASGYGNLCNALCDLRRLDRALEAGLRAVQMEPNNANYHANVARAHELSERYVDALNSYRLAQKLEPGPARLVDIGRMLVRLGEFEEAQQELQRALAEAPEALQVHESIGNLYESEGQLDLAESHYRTLTQRKPRDPQGHVHLGRLLIKKGLLEEARQEFLAVEALDAQHVEAHFGQAIIHFLRGEFEQALPRYESRRRMGIFRSRKSTLSEWTQRDDAWGKTVLLCNEQGIGDTIQYVRYAAVVRGFGADAIISCPPELLRLFRINADLGPVVTDNETPAECDLMIPMLSLMHVTGTRIDTIPCEIPYLHADPAQAAFWQDIIGGRLSSAASGAARGDTRPPHAASGGRVSHEHSSGGRGPHEHSSGGRGPHEHSSGGRVSNEHSSGGRVSSRAPLKVGLVWAGRRQHPNDRNRSLPLSAFAPLLEISGIAFFSLQIGEQRAELEQPAVKNRITDLAPHIKDFADTAGAIDQLDLLISVDTAPVHLAGAMGKPVWTLLSFAPDWRWMLEREDTPWYPTMRLFRQPRPGDWASVIQRVAKELRKVELEGGWPQPPSAAGLT